MANEFSAEMKEARLDFLEPAFRTALSALELEDRRLALGFQQAGSRLKPGLNRGLAYWVFEHNLVYEIFKAWLPNWQVYWEEKYPTSAEHADLVLYEGAEAAAVIEAKWWMNNHEKTVGALDADIRKLRTWPEGPAHRILLGFWYSQKSPGSWAGDLSQVRDFCHTYKDGSVKPVFAGSFDTDVSKYRDGAGAYFAMVALNISA